MMSDVTLAPLPPKSFDLLIDGISATHVWHMSKRRSGRSSASRRTRSIWRPRASVQGRATVTTDVLAAAVRRAGYEVGNTEVTLQVEGMTCASCAGRVEAVLLRVSDMPPASVNLDTELATVQTLSTVTAAELKAAVERAEYAASE